MTIAHIKLDGLNRERLVAAAEPILLARGVEGVEFAWRTDGTGWILLLSLACPGSKIPGEGITIELCSLISRELSAVLDAEDIISQAYQLEVGSPGLERGLYSVADYERFAGLSAKLKLRAAIDGQKVLSGTLCGLAEDGSVLIETERGKQPLAFDDIDTGRLVFDWNKPGAQRGSKAKGHNPRSSGSGDKPREPKRSR